MKITKTYCRFCLAQCGLIAQLDGSTGEISIRGDRNDPISKGYSCSKGRSLGLFNRTNRLLQPSMREADAEGEWPRVIESFARKIEAAIKEAGKNAFGIYAGTNSIMDAAGQWAAIGLMIRLGSKSYYSVATIDAVSRAFVAGHMCGNPSLFPQLHDEAKLWILVGTNPVVSHGHIAGFPNPLDRIRTFKKRGGKLIVIDPRKTETARLADVHLSNKPGSDYYLLGYLIKEILREGSDIKCLSTSVLGLDELRLEVAHFNREDMEGRTGVTRHQVDSLLTAIRQNRRVAMICGTGVTFSQEAVKTEFYSWALMAITGSLDSTEGCWFNPGWFSLRTGQPHYVRTNGSGPGPKSRPELQSYLGEMSCAALADEIEGGHLKVLMVLGGNPLASIANGRRIKAAFGKLEALGVADVKNSELTRQASHLFSVGSQLERSDTSAYIDKNMSGVYARYTRPVVTLPPLARPLWWVIQSIGETLGVDAVGLGLKAEKLTDDIVLRSICRRDPESFDILVSAGIQIGEPKQPVGWIERWIEEGQFKWNLNPPSKSDACPTEEPSSKVVLISGRQRYHLNSTFVDERMSDGHFDESLLTINPIDAEKESLKTGDMVEISNQNGKLRIKVRVSKEIRQGVVHIPHGWGNTLTSEYMRVDRRTGMTCQTAIPIGKIEKISVG